MGITDRSAAELRREAEHAAEIRALISDPNVIALRVEKVRQFVDWMFGIAVVLCLLFTMVSVQQFAAQGVPQYSFEWWTAWLLDPAFSCALIGVLIAEVKTARYGVKLGFWPEVSKWFFLLSVLTMNTWMAFAVGSAARVVLHAGPVALVFIVAQIAPAIREKLTEAVLRAEEAASQPAPSVSDAASQPPSAAPAEPVLLPAPVIPIQPAVAPQRQSADPSDAQLAAALRRDWIQRGQRPGEARMASQLNVPRSQIKRLLAQMPDPVQSNGHRPSQLAGAAR